MFVAELVHSIASSLNTMWKGRDWTNAVEVYAALTIQVFSDTMLARGMPVGLSRAAQNAAWCRLPKVRFDLAAWTGLNPQSADWKAHDKRWVRSNVDLNGVEQKLELLHPLQLIRSNLGGPSVSWTPRVLTCACPKRRCRTPWFCFTAHLLLP